ncbi:hypothetical protein BDY21DRAFT_140229 [Lineolata rhizophorae]|uniref:Uncharacterized protein n=1 Tax=Lineolata rhizophorae TaxID=578093 RepID=A0A6A6PB41_9PEZI|nr:hypothetical protein BDY21DRAFT_140229 [Lineolata rhizophorae]
MARRYRALSYRRRDYLPSLALRPPPPVAFSTARVARAWSWFSFPVCPLRSARIASLGGPERGLARRPDSIDRASRPPRAPDLSSSSSERTVRGHRPAFDLVRPAPPGSERARASASERENPLLRRYVAKPSCARRARKGLEQARRDKDPGAAGGRGRCRARGARTPDASGQKATRERRLPFPSLIPSPFVPRPSGPVAAPPPRSAATRGPSMYGPFGVAGRG